MPKRTDQPDPKTTALLEDGTWNPSPEGIRDSKFQQGEFFDPRDLLQVRYEMLRRVEKDGHSITDAAARFGFSRPSFYQARTALQAAGLAGLVPLKRGPRQAHKLTAEVMDFLRQTRRDDPSLGATELASCVQERFGLVVHPRTIERGLARDQKKRRKPG